MPTIRTSACAASSAIAAIAWTPSLAKDAASAALSASVAGAQSRAESLEAARLPVDAPLSKFASFSPDERKAAVWWVKDRRWHAGIHDLERGTVKALDIVPSMEEARWMSPAWISNDELTYVVTTPLNQLTEVAHYRATMEVMAPGRADLDGQRTECHGGQVG